MNLLEILFLKDLLGKRYWISKLSYYEVVLYFVSYTSLIILIDKLDHLSCLSVLLVVLVAVQPISVSYYYLKGRS